MPNRVDSPINGIRPTTARREDLQAARTDARQTQRTDAAGAQADRVEISDAARTRNQELNAATDPQAQRGAAVNAPSTQRSEPAGSQGNVERPTEQNAELLREQQEAARQQAPARPEAQQGNLVDVTG